MTGWMWQAQSDAEHDGHAYLSTACWHAERDGREELHDYCKADTGLSGSKRPAECKWCGSPCRCGCHDV